MSIIGGSLTIDLQFSNKFFIVLITGQNFESDSIELYNAHLKSQI